MIRTFRQAIEARNVPTVAEEQKDIARLRSPHYFQFVSTTDLIVEKLKGLPEIQAEAVLTFIREMTESRHLTATELMRLAPAERRRILSNQARQAEVLYRQRPDMIVEDAEAPLKYG